MRIVSFTELLKRTPKTVRPILKEIKQELDFKGVPLNLYDTDSLMDADGRMSGFFGYIDRYEPELNIAVGTPFETWIGILIHEYMHFKQWESNTQIWQDGYIEITDTSGLLSLWLDHRIELTKKQRNDVIDRVFEIERDCERRTVTFLRKHKIPIDITEYIRGANSYLLFYLVVKHIRRWYKHRAPYEIKSLTHLCRGDRIYKHRREIDKDLLTVFINYYKKHKRI